MIKKIGSQYFVFNHTGVKKLSKGFSSLTQAKARLRVIEFFKHNKGVQNDK